MDKLWVDSEGFAQALGLGCTIGVQKTRGIKKYAECENAKAD